VPCVNDLQHAPRYSLTVKVKVKGQVQVGTDRRRRWWCCWVDMLYSTEGMYGTARRGAWRCLEVLGGAW